MPENLTYIEIAQKILKDDPKLKRIHYKDLTKRAFDLDLIESDDILIAGNLSSAINLDFGQKKASSLYILSEFFSFYPHLFYFFILFSLFSSLCSVFLSLVSPLFLARTLFGTFSVGTPFSQNS